MITLQHTVRRRGDVAVQGVPGTTGVSLLVDMNAGTCWELNSLGTEVWAHLDGKYALSDIRSLLVRRYDVPIETLTADLLTITKNLLGAGLVELVDSPAAGNAGFAERFAWATFRDSGIVVDLQTGSYWRINAAAIAMIEEFERCSYNVEATVLAIQSRLGISGDTAAEQLRTLISDLTAGSGASPQPLGPFRYGRHEDGYALWHGEQLVLLVAADGTRLQLVASLSALTFPPLEYVRAVAPKLLVLQGVTVLHGSGCIVQSGLLGLCGLSRAGKTTTARLLAKQGATLVSEDLLVLTPDLRQPAAFLNGESVVQAWAARAANDIRSGDAIDCEGVREALSGTSARLTTLWFLDSARRGASLVERALGPVDVACLLLKNAFLGASDAQSWRRQLEVCQILATAVAHGFELSVPDGVDRLSDALGIYMRNSAS